jgi:hypothetical protein
MYVAIQVPTDSGLSVTVTVTIRYYRLKEQITRDIVINTHNFDRLS